jgi:hypothetical protein
MANRTFLTCTRGHSQIASTRFLPVIVTLRIVLYNLDVCLLFQHPFVAGISGKLWPTVLEHVLAAFPTVFSAAAPDFFEKMYSDPMFPWR